MSIITSEAHFRQRLLKYSLKYGVTKASNRFGRSRQAIYEWRAKWDGKSWKSLVERSHRPHHHPNDIYEVIIDSYPTATYELGVLYKNGVLSSPPCPDYQKAAMCLQIAVEKGHVRAAYELAELYFNPTGKFKCDFLKAQKYYEIAAEGGFDRANYVLGYMCEYGHVKKDIRKAINHYEKAYEQGHVLSAAHLGILYQQPEYHNYERAFECCKYAADAGDTPSEFALGVLYLCGRVARQIRTKRIYVLSMRVCMVPRKLL